MAWTDKEKELVAVGISVAAGCRPCTKYHYKHAREMEISDDEIRRAVEAAISVRKQAAINMESFAITNLKSGDEGDSNSLLGDDRISVMVRIGAAYAVNSTADLEIQLMVTESVAISGDELQAIAKLAGFIRGKAISHVEKLIPLDNITEP
ncbi:carboxymuconolactone decarboxylase family protein [Photobacterium sagamiensis]|uniref:carboxymuconolactone decarboxylase family protein n=1 Tax=Photobacterium sagamiensis TaxID=2910241 RepID=UPI003D113D45